ncbi:hypothetical protein [Mesorhizobium sp.]|uniref:hypothetical protein n=1 Tax=Mesorhizobium sp. TaxID=1871066 RepID=UPI0025C0933E|nr:hypothetical protein [Mesorhizobium sp.]
MTEDVERHVDAAIKARKRPARRKDEGQPYPRPRLDFCSGSVGSVSGKKPNAAERAGGADHLLERLASVLLHRPTMFSWVRTIHMSAELMRQHALRTLSC